MHIAATLGSKSIHLQRVEDSFQTALHHRSVTPFSEFYSSPPSSRPQPPSEFNSRCGVLLLYSSNPAMRRGGPNSLYQEDTDDEAWKKTGEADASSSEDEGAPLQSDAASGQATVQFGLDLGAAVETGINLFRARNDGTDVVDQYAKIKAENSYSKEKTNLTPWMRSVRKKMKAIHA